MKYLNKKSIIYFLFIMLIITFLFEIIDLPVAKKNDATSFIDYLNQNIPKYLIKYTTAGLAIGLIHNGEIIFLKGYGLSNIEKKIPVNEKTIFQVASISKPVTAVGIMKLIEQEKISIDAPVKSYLTRWHFPSSKYNINDITIRRLLSHSAGLANPEDGYNGSLSPFNLPTIEKSLSDPREGVFIVYQPGTKYLYSGVGFTLLQLTIEEVTNLKFNDYMKKEVLLPLQMLNSTFDFDEVKKNNLAIVYDDNGKPLQNLYFTEKAAAGLYSDINDLTNFVLSMIPDDKKQNTSILKSETIYKMYIPQKGIKDISPNGLGFCLEKLFFRNYYEVIHYGTNGPGWCACISLIPDKKEGIVVLTNSPGGQAIRYILRSSWLNWVTGSTNFWIKIQKLVNILKIIIPISFLGIIILIIILFVKSKIKFDN